ncbi:transcriptional regulator NrdR family protein [Prauserella sediminis]|uniref:Transcriptional regulator NrdR family protein n=1 Tax=Prauserella sediminis TaxID=577680 RepID=A0A839XQ23_9PSEU|nr:hypothetical protein [Prauserella sediminis]MBB3662958.1 transcriptional regulator NrdR family protein [Prauserella sediminis]
MTTCPFCGWPDSDVVAVLSRHRTPEGETVWTRCACGSLQTRVVGAAGTAVVVRGRPHEAEARPVTDTPGDVPCDK